MLFVCVCVCTRHGICVGVFVWVCARTSTHRCAIHPATTWIKFCFIFHFVWQRRSFVFRRIILPLLQHWTPHQTVYVRNVRQTMDIYFLVRIECWMRIQPLKALRCIKFIEKMKNDMLNSKQADPDDRKAQKRILPERKKRIIKKKRRSQINFLINDARYNAHI